MCSEKPINNIMLLYIDIENMSLTCENIFNKIFGKNVALIFNKHGVSYLLNVLRGNPAYKETRGLYGRRIY